MNSEKITIKDLIVQAGKYLRSEFEEIKRNNPHFGESGTEAEIVLIDFLNDRIPKRFKSDTGFVIDLNSQISRQIDVVIYDVLNSPIYRKGKRVSIIPNDNVAVAIEVKSKLNKKQLNDAAQKISSVKKLKKTPISEADEPVTFSPLIMANTLGVVFAYESDTALETLTENLGEINSQYPSKEWIDLIVVLDKGIIGYTVQFPLESKFPGWFGGVCSDEFPIPPYYIHLVKSELGELTLNQFFINLIAHLTFFRRRTAMSFESVLGQQPLECMTLKGYQYNLKRELVAVEEKHTQGKFQNPKVRFNLYKKDNKAFLGQICYLPWQDGAVVMYSGYIHPPQAIFKPYFEAIEAKNQVIVPGAAGANLWLSSVIQLTEEKFISVSERFLGSFFAERDCDDDSVLPWSKYQDNK